MTNAQKIRSTCTRCGGDGQYHAPTSLPGGCFACKGRGYFLTSPATIARREQREAAAQANADAVTAAARSNAVIENLLAAWGDEFSHIDEEYRHAHVTQKAQRILFQGGAKISNYVGELDQHYAALGINA